MLVYERDVFEKVGEENLTVGLKSSQRLQKMLKM